MQSVTLDKLLQKMRPLETGPAPFDAQLRRYVIYSAVILALASLVLLWIGPAMVEGDYAWLWGLALGLNVAGLGCFVWLWFQTDGLKVGAAEHNMVARGAIALAVADGAVAVVATVLIIIAVIFAIILGILVMLAALAGLASQN